MKTFMALYTGSASPETRAAFRDSDRVAAAMDAWRRWGERHGANIVDPGSPLGRTKRVSARGIAEARNHVTAYVIVRAESYDEAARMFEEHPHFTIFPGDAVEIMECLPIPNS